MLCLLLKVVGGNQQIHLVHQQTSMRWLRAVDVCKHELSLFVGLHPYVDLLMVWCLKVFSFACHSVLIKDYDKSAVLI